MRKKTHFFCKNVLLHSKNNISMVLQISISLFSCILKIKSINTFSAPQPDSASYPLCNDGKCCFSAPCKGAFTAYYLTYYNIYSNHLKRQFKSYLDFYKMLKAGLIK